MNERVRIRQRKTDTSYTQQRTKTTETGRQLGQEYLFPSLDATETYVLSYGLKHSETPKRTPTEAVLFLVLKQFCLVTVICLNQPNITSEAGLHPPYNQPHYMTAT